MRGLDHIGVLACSKSHSNRCIFGIGLATTVVSFCSTLAVDDGYVEVRSQASAICKGPNAMQDGLSAEVAVVNLLRNPSFEIVPGPQQGQGLLPTDWVMIALTPDTFSNDGSYGLPPHAFGYFPGVVARDAIRWVAALATTTAEMFGQQLSSPLLPSQNYRLTGWLHQAPRADLANPGSYEFLLATSSTTPQSAVVLGRFPSTTQPQWERRTLQFTAPADATSRPWLVIRPVPTGTVASVFPGLDGLILERCTMEVCNGMDDDCDDLIDEGNPGGGMSCNTGVPGICALGTMQCQSGTQTCIPNLQPANESCNGLDDNCNGSVDEGNPGGGAPCVTGLMGICAAGTITCQNAMHTCVQNAQSALESCNQLDDDCDGQVDEGFVQTQFNPLTGGTIDVALGGACIAGHGECETPGTLQCRLDGTGLDCVPVMPPPQSAVEGPHGHANCLNLDDDDCDGMVDYADPDCMGPELCDGADNDGNGQIDELWPLRRTPCEAGLGACAQPGVWRCASGRDSLECSALPLSPGTEGPPNSRLCADGFDNDCDGQTDIHDANCQTPENCDKKDNNGNGQVDEDFPLLGGPCVAGLGECERDGFYDCTSDGTGVHCSAPPGPRRPEGVGCQCSDGLDNDCDGLIDEADPDCGSTDLRVQASLPTVCRHPGGDCHSWHTVQWDTQNAGPGLVETAELVALGTDGAILGSFEVMRGDMVRLTSRVPAAFTRWWTQDWTLDGTSFGNEVIPCSLGPNVPISSACARVDTDCDSDVDLKDFAALTNRFGDTITFRSMTAPRPLLRVHANDGFGRATAYASPVPHVRVWSPDETVVSLSEGDRVRVEVALANVDVATLELFIDGVSLFPALGLIPGIAFPGGPYDGTVPLPNQCTANVCDLIVDAADLETPAANVLTMYVENLCCGGHRFVARSAPRPGSYPNPLPPLCDPTDMSDDGVSHGFDVTVLAPTDGAADLSSPTAVVGIACHGLPLQSPIPSADRMVRLNGAMFPMNLPTITKGDGVFTADTYRYSFQGILPATNLFEDLVLGNGIPGTLDPGGNKLIAEVLDPQLNTTFDVQHVAIAPAALDLSAPDALAGGGSSAVAHGFSVTMTAPTLVTIATGVLESLAPQIVQMVTNMVETFRDTELLFPTDICDIVVGVLVDDPVPFDFTMNPNDFTFVVTPVIDQVNLTATSGPIHAAGSVTGSCQINLFGECLIRVVLEAGAELDIDRATFALSVTENDLINGTPLQPILTIAQDEFEVTVVDVESRFECWGGDVLDASTFTILDDLVTELIQELAQQFIDDLNVDELIGLLNVAPIPLDALTFAPVNIAAFNVDFAIDLNEVQISPLGITAGFQTEFIPTQIDPEVFDVPEAPATIASLPLPPLPDPPADGLTALIADDAVNQLLDALTRNGLIKTQFEDVRQIVDLLPADCSILPIGAYGFCEALKGTICTSIQVPVESAACAAANALLNAANVSGDTTILLQGRLDVPPKFFAFDAAQNVLTVYIRLSQAYVGIIADRDGDGMFAGDYSSLPSCLAGNLGSSTECALWGACFDVTFTATLTLNVLPGGAATLAFDLTAADLSSATGCAGGVSVAGAVNGLEAIFEGPVFALVQTLVDNNFPPLSITGLDFGGAVTLDNPHPITFGNQFDPMFEDTFGLTMDLLPNP